MSEQLYNVSLDYGYEEPHPGTAVTFQSIAHEAGNVLRAVQLKARAKRWLMEQDRIYDLVNIYDNQADGLLFKFRDRNTALLFRLSL
jgi:hypothetical protein